MNSYSLVWVKTLCQYTKQKYCYILPQNWLSLNFKESTLVLNTFPIFFLIGLHLLVKLAQAGTAWRLLWCPDPAVGKIHTCSMLCMPTPTVTPVHGHHNRITKQTCLTLPFVWLRNVYGCFSFDTGSHVTQDSLTFPLFLLPSLSCALIGLCRHNWLKFWDISVTWVALCFLGLKQSTASVSPAACPHRHMAAFSGTLLFPLFL